MRRVILIAIALLSGSRFTLACTCGRSSPFAWVAAREPLVVVATVERYIYERPSTRPVAMDVCVSSTLKGIQPAKVLRVYGDRGKSCAPYVTKFPIGTTWVFALSALPVADAVESSISICGEYWLPVENDKAVGSISAPFAKPHAVTLEQLKKEIEDAEQPTKASP